MPNFKFKIDEAGISSMLSLILRPNAEILLDVIYTKGEHNTQVETTKVPSISVSVEDIG